MKEMPLEDSSSYGDKSRERLDLELSLCQSLRHPNIVSYLGHEYTDQHLHIFLEFMAGGSVASLLKEFGALQGEALRKATSDTLCGLDFLHTLSPPVVHRDLKGANLLVDLDMTVKVADFGCSKWSNDTKSFTTLGSVPWMAPEVISQSEGHGRKADIWSFGCTVIEMATAEKPWGDGAFGNMVFALNHIANSDSTPQLPPHCTASSECRGLVEWCTRRSARCRPTTAQLLQHEFLASQCRARRKAG